jgi:hypothetical protein
MSVSCFAMGIVTISGRVVSMKTGELGRYGFLLTARFYGLPVRQQIDNLWVGYLVPGLYLGE